MWVAAAQAMKPKQVDEMRRSCVGCGPVGVLAFPVLALPVLAWLPLEVAVLILAAVLLGLLLLCRPLSPRCRSQWDPGEDIFPTSLQLIACQAITEPFSLDSKFFGALFSQYTGGCVPPAAAVSTALSAHYSVGRSLCVSALYSTSGASAFQLPQALRSAPGWCLAESCVMADIESGSLTPCDDLGTVHRQLLEVEAASAGGLVDRTGAASLNAIACSTQRAIIVVQPARPTVLKVTLIAPCSPAIRSVPPLVIFLDGRHYSPVPAPAAASLLRDLSHRPPFFLADDGADLVGGNPPGNEFFCFHRGSSSSFDDIVFPVFARSPGLRKRKAAVQSAASDLDEEKVAMDDGEESVDTFDGPDSPFESIGRFGAFHVCDRHLPSYPCFGFQTNCHTSSVACCAGTASSGACAFCRIGINFQVCSQCMLARKRVPIAIFIHLCFFLCSLAQIPSPSRKSAVCGVQTQLAMLRPGLQTAVWHTLRRWRFSAIPRTKKSKSGSAKDAVRQRQLARFQHALAQHLSVSHHAARGYRSGTNIMLARTMQRAPSTRDAGQTYRRSEDDYHDGLRSDGLARLWTRVVEAEALSERFPDGIAICHSVRRRVAQLSNMSCVLVSVPDPLQTLLDIRSEKCQGRCIESALMTLSSEDVIFADYDLALELAETVLRARELKQLK